MRPGAAVSHEGAPANRWAFAAVALAFFLSGAAGLIYEVVWQRELVRAIGGTATATATVLAVFMAGMGLGAVLAGPRCERATPERCLQAYIVLECLVALTGLLTLLVLDTMPEVYAWLAQWMGFNAPARVAARAAVSIVALLPPTVLMGATFPPLVRAGQALLGGGHTSPAGALYGLNACGAVTGTLLSGFWLLPTFGDRGTVHCAAGVNIAAVLITTAVVGARPPRSAATSRRDTAASRRPPTRLLVIAASTGLLVLGFEVLWTRTLVPLIGSSVFAFASVLATVLVGLAIGSSLSARWGDGLRDPESAFGWLAGGTAVAALLCFHFAPRLVGPAISSLEWSEDPLWRGLGLPVLLAAPLVLLPTALSGAALPVGIRAGSRGCGIATAAGWIYGANTVGSIVGALVTGLVLLPLVGTRWSVVVVACCGSAMVAGALLRSPTPKRQRGLLVGALAVTTALLATALPSLDVRLFAGGLHAMSARYRRTIAMAGVEAHFDRSQVLFAEEGASTTVLVEERAGHRVLFTGGRPVATTSTLDTRNQYALAHIPALLHGRPCRSLVIGLGTGMTAGGLLAYGEVDIAEISPAMLGAAPHFREHNHDVVASDRARIVVEDGQVFLRARPGRYDVITVDPVHPYVAGAAALYTIDHFAAVRARLTEEGVAAHWLPLYQMGWQDVTGVLASFLHVFPDATVYLTGGDAVLVGRAGGEMPAPSRFAAGLEDAHAAEDLHRVFLDTPERVAALASFGPAEVAELAAGARLVTHDHTWLEFTAPRWTQAKTHDNLRRLIEARRPARAAASPEERRARATYDVLLRDHLASWSGEVGLDGRIQHLAAALAADPDSREVESRLSVLREAARRIAKQ